MITPEQQDTFWRAVQGGCSVQESARRAKVSYSWARRQIKPENANGQASQETKRQRPLANPRTREQLCPEALKALDNFGYFQRRYMGRIPVYWQQKSADRIVEYLQSPDEEYLVLNVAPGTGKTTTYAHDIPAWLTCRDRSIRGALGHAIQSRASLLTRRLRNTFEMTVPIRNEQKDVDRGIALHAEATLSGDFGRFKPVNQEMWTAAEFFVMQLGGVPVTEKEATWTSISREMEFLGGRWDFILWDDLVTAKRQRTEEMIEEDRRWWDNYGETRLEPGGLLALVGQRIGAGDLYNYSLDKKAAPPEDDDETPQIVLVESENVDTEPRKYHHIVFKAHYEEECKGAAGHKLTSPAYGEGGCVLYPARLPGSKLLGIQANDTEGFEVTYQQGDVDPAQVLVRPEWVTGGAGHPGCWDKDRDRLEYPKAMVGPLLSVLTADPSATKYWGVEWWLYQPSTEQRFLIDMDRKKMEAPDFLDWNHNSQCFTGMLEEWWQTSLEIGIPITHVIVEVNAAQRYLLQYEHVHRWMMLRSVQIIPHSTHRNKTDPEFGVQMLRDHYRFGRVRLPGKASSIGRAKAQQLVFEVTHYPKVATTDCMMAQWFFEFQLQHIYIPGSGLEVLTDGRPSWMGGTRKAA